MKTYLQITGGRGPVECARTVALVAQELQKACPDLVLVDYEAHNTKPGCFMSMTFSIESDQVENMKKEWEGSILWVATWSDSMLKVIAMKHPGLVLWAS